MYTRFFIYWSSIVYKSLLMDNDDHVFFVLQAMNTILEKTQRLLYYFIENFNKLLEKFRHYVKSNYATVEFR